MRKKLLRMLTVLLALALVLTGCGSTEGAQGSAEKVRLMVWSPSEDQSKDSGEWLQTCCEQFAQLHPEWDITFVYGVADEATAASTVSQDPSASADVFLFANDTLTTLTDAGALAKFGGKYADQVLATNSAALTDSLTLDGYLYGVPFTTNTWFRAWTPCWKRVWSASPSPTPGICRPSILATAAPSLVTAPRKSWEPTSAVKTRWRSPTT